MTQEEIINLVWAEIKKSPLSTTEIRENIYNYLYGNEELEELVEDLCSQFEQNEPEADILKEIKYVLGG